MANIEGSSEGIGKSLSANPMPWEEEKKRLVYNL